jgi:hypothetical protein
MKFDEQEREILEKVQYGRLHEPIGLQMANALRALWSLYTGKPFNTFNKYADGVKTYLFDHIYWGKFISRIRTRWTHPLHGDSHTRTPFDHAIKKIRREAECLNRRNGHCSNPCPNPGYDICPRALEPAEEVDY